MDRVWEAHQIRGVACFRQGDLFGAGVGWRNALDLAVRNLNSHDPRLATSYANYAFALRIGRKHQAAVQAFERSLGIWQSGWQWISEMDQAWIRKGCGPQAISWCRALSAKGEAATLDLYIHDRPGVRGLERWYREKDRVHHGLRHLASSVLLLVSNQGTPGQLTTRATRH
ncbi:MAG: tetratricopeptide repeat protein [Geminicoccaceae bacterium]